jgi:hypothetical protein
MPTTITAPAHRLAALIAVEREAASRYRKASRDIVLRAISFDPRSDEYRAADAEEAAAFRALSARHGAAAMRIHIRTQGARRCTRARSEDSGVCVEQWSDAPIRVHVPALDVDALSAWVASVAHCGIVPRHCWQMSRLCGRYSMSTMISSNFRKIIPTCQMLRSERQPRSSSRPPSVSSRSTAAQAPTLGSRSAHSCSR